jgi:hypothetical protein
MFKKVVVFTILGLMIYSCQNGEEKLSEADQIISDSLSKMSQKRRADSLKSLNPLLILPPDSEYTGDYIDKYSHGIVKYRGYFRFGKRHGQWIAFYGNGLPWSEQHYDKGIKSGANIVYYENAKVRYKGYYKNDVRDSVWSFYDSTGKLMKTLVYKEGKELASSGMK